MKKNETVDMLLDRSAKLTAEFEKRQAEFAEAQKAYNKAKTVIVDFRSKYGGILKLFED